MKQKAKSGISERERRFIDRRRNVVRYWRFAGPLLVVMVVGFAAWLYLRTPLLIDPFEMLARLEAGEIPESTLVIMAALVPVLFLGLLVLLAGLVVIMYAAISGEKRYLAIIETLSDGK